MDRLWRHRQRVRLSFKAVNFPETKSNLAVYGVIQRQHVKAATVVEIHHWISRDVHTMN
jgi:hypothetical protein